MRQLKKIGEDQLKLEESLVDKFGLKATWALDSKYKHKAMSENGEVEVTWTSTALSEQEVSGGNTRHVALAARRWIFQPCGFVWCMIAHNSLGLY